MSNNNYADFILGFYWSIGKRMDMGKIIDRCRHCGETKRLIPTFGQMDLMSCDAISYSSSAWDSNSFIYLRCKVCHPLFHELRDPENIIENIIESRFDILDL